MARVGLYLSGSGSLDGSDVIISVLAYTALQKTGHDPVPVGRDIGQGRVVDHRTAQSQAETRNALSEAARIVRGNIRDMREVEPERMAGAVLVGGDGTLSTWTDFHQRGPDCRVTERLKHHVLDFFQAKNPLVCLGNAGFVLARILRNQAPELSVNVGSNQQLIQAVNDWGVSVTEASPSWDEANQVGCQPAVARSEDLPEVSTRIEEFLRRSLG